MHERVQVEGAAAIARQEQAPPGPEVTAVCLIQSEVSVVRILAPRLSHDEIEETPQLAIWVCKLLIVELARTVTFDDPCTVGPHLSDDFLDQVRLIVAIVNAAY